MGKNFKRIKGTGEVYDVPEALKSMTGMQLLSADGIRQMGEWYDKAYYCSENKEAVRDKEKVRGCTMLLRSTDVTFCFYEWKEQCVLLLALKAKTMEEAETAFRVLEEELVGNLHTFGITIFPIQANEMLSLMHRLVMSDFPMARLDINQYLKRGTAWIPDFELNKHTEGKKNLEAGERQLSVMYVRRLPAEHAAAIYQFLRRIRGCKLVVTVYEPIADRELVRHIKEEYMGAEEVLNRLKKRNTGIGKLLLEEAEERRYVFAGIYFVLEAANEAELEEAKGKLAEALSKYSCRLAECDGYQKQAYRSILTLNPWKIRQLRLLPVQDTVKMNPFYPGEEYREEPLESKEALLAAFDEMIR